MIEASRWGGTGFMNKASDMWVVFRGGGWLIVVLFRNHEWVASIIKGKRTA